ncbi:CD225/dispanin family protein [Pseudoxanthomonas koreensis]|uniref:CD225/dispanin family protein n=1 Tax=Pseudoxanthomonas koreensis TaxID=266061 RepID=UPI0035A5B2FC
MSQPIPTHLVWAILSTLLCCWPLGVVSIVYACRVDRHRAEGDLDGALEASRKAGLWALWSALSVAIIFGLFVLFALLGELLK